MHFVQHLKYEEDKEMIKTRIGKSAAICVYEEKEYWVLLDGMMVLPKTKPYLAMVDVAGVVNSIICEFGLKLKEDGNVLSDDFTIVGHISMSDLKGDSSEVFDKIFSSIMYDKEVLLQLRYSHMDTYEKQFHKDYRNDVNDLLVWGYGGAYSSLVPESSIV